MKFRRTLLGMESFPIPELGPTLLSPGRSVIRSIDRIQAGVVFLLIATRIAVGRGAIRRWVEPETAIGIDVAVDHRRDASPVVSVEERRLRSWIRWRQRASRSIDRRSDWKPSRRLAESDGIDVCQCERIVQHPLAHLKACVCPITDILYSRSAAAGLKCPNYPSAHPTRPIYCSSQQHPLRPS